VGCVDIATCGAASIALRHTLRNKIPNRYRRHIIKNSLIFILALNTYINILQSDVGVLVNTITDAPKFRHFN
jgi:hypothetical protein